MSVKNIQRLLVVIIIVFVAFFVATHSFVEVTFIDKQAGTVDVTLKKDGDKNATKITSTNSIVKRLVSKGSYEVMVKKDGASYFSIVKNGGFLSTKRVSANLEKERSRSFVGNNPGPCLYFDVVLFSAGCSDRLTQIVTHKPAADKLPTYTEPVKTTFEGRIEGFIKTENAHYVLARLTSSEEEDKILGHYLHPIEAGGNIATGLLLKDADKDRSYSISAYKSGFILYSNFGDILYYPNPQQTPERLNIKAPEDSSLTAFALSTSKTGIAISYGTLDTASDTTSAPRISRKQKSVVVVQTDDGSKHFEFSKLFGQVALCGKSKLCALYDGELEVFDISGNDQRLLYSIRDVTSIIDAGDKTLIVRNGEVLGFDIDKASGSIIYSLGGYSLCGVQSVKSGYVICVIDSKKKKAALFVDSTQIDMDSIDKKIDKLSQLPQVRAVSIYGRFVHISPNYGPRVITPDGNYDIDRSKKQGVDAAIQNELDAIGIDRKAYDIKSTFR